MHHEVEESISSNTNYYMAAAPLLPFETYIQNGEYISEPPPQYYQAARQSCLEAFFTCHNFALVLLSCGAISLLVYGAFGWGVGFYVGGGVLYLFYVCCFCKSKTAKYVSTKLTPLGAEEYVNDLRRVTPSFTFHVRCWHTETSTSTTTDADGNTSTSTSTSDVTTYEADEAFVYRRVRDISGALAGISPSDVTRLNIKAEYRFSDEPTRLAYVNQGRFLYHSNKGRDDNCDVTFKMDIAGLTPYVLCTSPDHQACWLQKCYFYLFSCVGLAACFATALDANSLTADYRLVKDISIL